MHELIASSAEQTLVRLDYELAVQTLEPLSERRLQELAAIAVFRGIR